VRSFHAICSFLLGGLVLLIAAAAEGQSLPPQQARHKCKQSLKDFSLSLRATGIETSGNWALLSINGDENILVNEGGIFADCFSLSKVTKNSIIVSATRTRSSKEFFFGGFSTAHEAGQAAVRTARDGFTTAYKGYKITQVSANMYKLSYPPFSNCNTLPQVVFRNERGAALYDDFETLGVDNNSESKRADVTSEGVPIGKNSSESIFGSLGLTEGDRIISINGKKVSTPKDIGRIMRDSGDAPIHIGYSEGSSSGIITTTVLINRVQKGAS
jgi:hypothetical protein